MMMLANNDPPNERVCYFIYLFILKKKNYLNQAFFFGKTLERLFLFFPWNFSFFANEFWDQIFLELAIINVSKRSGSIFLFMFN